MNRHRTDAKDWLAGYLRELSLKMGNRAHLFSDIEKVLWTSSNIYDEIVSDDPKAEWLLKTFGEDDMVMALKKALLMLEYAIPYLCRDHARGVRAALQEYKRREHAERLSKFRVV